MSCRECCDICDAIVNFILAIVSFGFAIHYGIQENWVAFGTELVMATVLGLSIFRKIETIEKILQCVWTTSTILNAIILMITIIVLSTTPMIDDQFRT